MEQTFGLSITKYNELVDKGFVNIKELTRVYGIKGLETGYMESIDNDSNCIVPNAIHIKKIDQLGVFKSDWDACRQAEKDGVKFINDIEGLEKGFYIDTPTNRLICTQILKEHPEYKVENWITPEDGEFGTLYFEYFYR